MLHGRDLGFILIGRRVITDQFQNLGVVLEITQLNPVQDLFADVVLDLLHLWLVLEAFDDPVKHGISAKIKRVFSETFGDRRLTRDVEPVGLSSADITQDHDRILADLEETLVRIVLVLDNLQGVLGRARPHLASLKVHRVPLMNSRLFKGLL